MSNYIGMADWDKGHRKAQKIKGFDLMDFAVRNNLSPKALDELDGYYQVVCRRVVHDYLKNRNDK